MGMKDNRKSLHLHGLQVRGFCLKFPMALCLCLRHVLAFGIVLIAMHLPLASLHLHNFKYNNPIAISIPTLISFFKLKR